MDVKKKILVEVKNDDFEKCRSLVEQNTGMKMSNSNLVNLLCRYYLFGKQKEEKK